MIDEIQYASALFRHLKSVVDTKRNRDGQYLLTGSQKFTLMRDVSESLAGRADILELETLSLAETRAALPRPGGEHSRCGSARSDRHGSRKTPTPAGVPVETFAPGKNVQRRESGIISRRQS